MEYEGGYADWWGSQWFPNDDSHIPDCGSIEKAKVTHREDQPVQDASTTQVAESPTQDTVRNKSEQECEEYANMRNTPLKISPEERQIAMMRMVEMQKEDDLDGWSVPVSRSKKLKPMRIKNKKDEATPVGPTIAGIKSSVNILESAKELNQVADKLRGEWEPIELTVDSGAEDTVAPPDELENIEADVTNAQGEGFRIADGSMIPNMGIKSGIIATEGWTSLKGVEFQVAPVHKTLLSVSKMVDRGHRVVFDDDDCGGSYVEDKASGEKTPLIRKRGLYVLQAWVRARVKKSDPDKKEAEKGKNAPGDEAPFQRPGR